FIVSATPEANVDPATLEQAVDKELEKVIGGPIETGELERARTLLKAQAIYARDGLTKMARIMGWILIVGLGKGFSSRGPQMIDAGPAERVGAAARDVLAARQSVTGLLLPEEPQKGAPQ